MKTFVFLLPFILFCLSLSTPAQEKTNNQYIDVPTLDYCDIIQNPRIYNGKVVRIFGEYTTAFEFSGLGSQNCVESGGRIWVEWENYQSCGDEKTARLLVNRSKGIEYNYLEGSFVGKFFVKEEGQSGFGHMNAKPFKLVVSCVEKATLLPKENSGCTRVDETSPFHYLEYVKTELDMTPSYKIGSKKKKREKVVWFRLVNNSSCPIVVPTIAKEAEKLEDNAKALVVYKLTSKIVSGDSIMTSTTPDRSATYEKSVSSILAAGSSIYFAVPLRYFKESFKIWLYTRSFWNISVPFEYVNRKAEQNYDPFYFAQNDLPKEIFKK